MPTTPTTVITVSKAKLEQLLAAITTTISNHVGSTSNPHQVTKAQVGLGSADNTADIDKPVSALTQNALNLKANASSLASKADTSALATKADLVNGVVPSAQLSAVTTHETVVVASKTAMLALTSSQVQPGDEAVIGNSAPKADRGRWMLLAADPSQIGSWLQLPTTSAVDSVQGQTGAVTLAASDVGAIPATAAGSNNGVATLGAGGKVVEGQLPDRLTEAGLPAAIVRNTPDRYGYVFTTFYNNGAGQKLYVYRSREGSKFTALANEPVYTPPTGILRDPSIIFWNGAWYVAYTVANFPDTSTKFGIARSTDLVNWTFLTEVDASGFPNVSATWAPEFVIDGTDLYVFVGLSSTGNSDSMQLHSFKAQNAALTSWGAPQLISLTHNPFSAIDSSVIKVDGVWHMFYREKTSGGVTTMRRATSSGSVLGPYTLQTAGNLTTLLGNGSEANSIVQLENGVYRLYYDVYSPGTGMFYVDSTDLVNWSQPTAVTPNPALPSGSILRHGTVWRHTPESFASTQVPTKAGRTAVQHFTTPVSINSANFVAVDNTKDLLVLAAAGDVVNLRVGSRWGTEADFGSLDVHTVAFGGTTFPSSVAQRGTPVANGGSIPGCTGESGVAAHIDGGIAYTVRAEDVRPDGTVRFRLMARTGGSTAKTFALSAATNNPRSYWQATNMGPALANP